MVAPQREQSGVIEVKFQFILGSLLEKKGIKVTDLVRDLDYPDSTVRDWLLGVWPRDPKVFKPLADYFGVSVNFLLYGENNINPKEYHEVKIPKPKKGLKSHLEYLKEF